MANNKKSVGVGFGSKKKTTTDTETNKYTGGVGFGGYKKTSTNDNKPLTEQPVTSKKEPTKTTKENAENEKKILSETSATLKKQLADTLAKSKAGEIKFDKDGIGELAKNYASVQFKIYDRNLKNGSTSIKPVGENLSNLFKAHGYDFNKLYPELAETYKTENVQGYAYQNSDKYKAKIDNEIKTDVDKLLGDFTRTVNNQIKADEAELAVLEEKQHAMGSKNTISGNKWINPSEKYDVETITKWQEEGVDFGDQIASKKADIESTKAYYTSASEVFKAKSNPDFAEKSKYILGKTPDKASTPGKTLSKSIYEEIADNHNRFPKQNLKFTNEDGSTYTVSVDKNGLTEDEYGTLMYILNTQGVKAADKFYDGISFNRNSKVAQSVHNTLQELEKGNWYEKAGAAIGETLYALASGTEGLITAPVKMIDDMAGVGDGYYEPTVAQQVTAKNVENAGDVGKIALQVTQTLPQLGAIVGATALAGPDAGRAVLAATVFPSSYVDAKNKGASDGQAISKASLDTGLEIITEHFIGNTIEGAGTSLSGILGSAAKKIPVTTKVLDFFGDVATKYPNVATGIRLLGKGSLGSGISEAGEEYTTALLSPYIENIVYGTNKKAEAWNEEEKESAAVGFLTGVLLGEVRNVAQYSYMANGNYGARIAEINSLSDDAVKAEYLSKLDTTTLTEIAKAENSDFDTLTEAEQRERIARVKSKIENGVTAKEAKAKLLEEEMLRASVFGMEDLARQGYSYDNAVKKLQKQGVNVSAFSDFAQQSYEIGEQNKPLMPDVSVDAVTLAKEGKSVSEISDILVNSGKANTQESAVRKANEAKNKVFAESLTPDMTATQRANAMQDRIVRERQAENEYLANKYEATRQNAKALFEENERVFTEDVVDSAVVEIAISVSKQLKNGLKTIVPASKINNIILENIVKNGDVDARNITTELADAYGSSITMSSNEYKVLTSSGTNITKALTNYAIDGTVPKGTSDKASFEAVAGAFKAVSDSAVRQVSNARTKLFGEAVLNLNNVSKETSKEVMQETSVPKESTNVTEEKVLNVEEDSGTMEAKKDSETNAKKKFEALRKKLAEKYGEEVTAELIKESKDISSDISEVTKKLTGKVVSAFKFVPYVLEAIASDNVIDARLIIDNGVYEVLSPFNVDKADFDSISDMASSRIEETLNELYGVEEVEEAGNNNVVEEDVVIAEPTEESIEETDEEVKTEGTEETATTDKDQEVAEVDESETVSPVKNSESEDSETQEEITNKPYIVTKTKHTSTGEDLWVVSLNERLSKEEFANLRNEVKKVGGYYSNFAKTLDGKPLQGFIFKSEPGVNELMVFGEENIGGNNDVFEADTTENIEQKSADENGELVTVESPYDVNKAGKDFIDSAKEEIDTKENSDNISEETDLPKEIVIDEKVKFPENVDKNKYADVPETFIFDADGELRFNQLDIDYSNSSIRRGKFNIIDKGFKSYKTVDGTICGKYGVHRSSETGKYIITLLQSGSSLSDFNKLSEAIDAAKYLNEKLDFNDVAFDKTLSGRFTIRRNAEIEKYLLAVRTILDSKEYLYKKDIPEIENGKVPFKTKAGFVSYVNSHIGDKVNVSFDGNASETRTLVSASTTSFKTKRPEGHISTLTLKGISFDDTGFSYSNENTNIKYDFVNVENENHRTEVTPKEENTIQNNDFVNIEEKRNKENERSETGILDSESEGYTGGSISEEVQSDEEGRNAGRSDELVSEDSTGEVSENARMVDGNENATEGVQHTESDTSGNLDSDGREHNDSEGRSDGTSASSSRKLNTHNYKITEDIDSKRPNINDNLEAIKLLKSLEESGKKPTKDQQAILARYKGWGGLKQAFTDYYYIRELKEVLTDEEFATARSTVLNAHYTSTKVIDGIYKGLSRLGFKGGNILEPSMGTGNFFGVMPSGIAGKSNLYGVEMDSITGRIAKMLYPDAAIEISPFQDVKYPEGAFDAVVGNVPFSEVTFPYKGGKYTLHDYFFLKSLDSLKEGGVAMLLTSTGTLDKLNVKARHEIAKRANLVAAFRLPNDAFKTNAGTSVTTDLIVLQKRGDTVPFNGIPFERVGKIGDIPINEYFVNNPENILGELVREKGMYAQERTQVNPSGEDFEKIWSKAISRLPKDLINGVTSEAPVDIATLNSNKSHFEEKDGNVIFYDSETGEVKNYTGKSAEKVKGYLAVKDAYNNLLESTKAGVNKTERDALRTELAKIYDDFNKKFGFLQDKANNFLDDDIEFVKVSGLEILNPKTKKLEKSGIFTSDTIGYVKPVKADTSVDALAISINESGKVDFKRMSELVGKSKEEIASDLEGSIIETPDGEYELISTYASGNIREKLRIVEGKKGYERNVEILKAAMPKDKTPSEIVPQLGASWINPKYIVEFIKETHNLGPYSNVKVSYDKTSGTWTVEKFYSNMHNMIQKFGTRRADAYEILVDTLNMKSTKVYDKYDDTRVLNTKETALARQKQAEVREAFSSWIFKDADRRSALVKEYNELFNNHRNMDYSELSKYLTFPGLNSSWKMRDYQKTAVARVVFGGNTLLAHGVGTGKTSEMIASAMEMKRMGITRKNVMVVPKHKVGDFRIDILKMYPEAKVLMATEKDFKKENRGKLFSKIGTNDWDIIIVGHSSFGLLPVSNETQAAYIEKEKAEIEEVINRAREEDGRNIDRRFIANLEKTLQRTESKLKDLLNATKDDTITFEELGIDGLFVDEAHNFKNLPFYTKLNLPGIKGSASKRASDLFMKTEYLRNSGGRIVFATATPVTNTISELYNMTRFVSPEVLKDAGIYSFDAWASNFGNIETKVEMSPDGKNFRTKERFSKYFNVPEMIGMFRQFADILRTSDVVKDLPKAKYIDVISPALDIHEGYIDSIVNRMKHMSSGGQTKNDNMLLVTSDGRAMATDLRLVASQLEGYDLDELDVESSRINKAVRNIVDEYKKSNEIKGTQFVFLDFGMNANEGGRYAYDLYGDIIEKLVNNGIPLNEIAKIGDYDTQAKKDDLFAKVNKGEIRVLIGSTAKMGEGMNAQERAVALHHLNAPYRPSDIEQREGRIIRYGNKNKDVNIYRYIQEKSFDSYMWQMLARKAEFINQAMSNGDISEIEETDEFVLSAKTGLAVASGNPLILKKVEIDEEVKRLQNLKKSYDASYYEMQERLIKLPSEIDGMERLMSNVKADIETLRKNESEDFKITLGKKVYDKRADAAKAIVPLVKNKYGATGSEIVGSYRGLDIKLSKAFTGSALYLGNKAEMKIELSESAEGNITKIVNAAGKFDAYLEFLTKKQDNLKKELDSIKVDIDKPFKYQSQLDKAIAEQAEIDAQLNFGEDNSDIVEDMNDEFESEEELLPNLEEETDNETETETGTGTGYTLRDSGKQGGWRTLYNPYRYAGRVREGRTRGIATTQKERTQYLNEIKSNKKYERINVAGRNFTVVKEDAYNDEMKALAQYNSQFGVTTKFFFGSQGLFNFRGDAFTNARNVILINYEAKLSPWDNNSHEVVHVNYETEQLQKIRSILKEYLDDNSIDLLSIKRYKKYNKYYKKNFENVFQEFVCDVVSGSSKYAASLPFNDLASAYWENDVSFIENYKGANTNKGVSDLSDNTSKKHSLWNSKDYFKDNFYPSLDDDGIYDYGDEWRELLEEYGYIPKGENPARDVDVPKKIDEKRVVSRFARTMMEAGVTPDHVMSEFEERILDGTMTHLEITNEAARNSAQKQIEYEGFEGALSKWNNLVDEGVVGKKQLVLGMELYNQCITNGDVTNAMRIAADLTAMATSAGQTLQACRVLKLMSPDGQLYYLEKSIKKLNEEFRKKLGDKYKDIELNDELLNEFLSEKDEAKRNEIYDRICKQIADQLPSSWKEKWDAWRYLAMLGNPRTHIRNIFGNAIFVPAIGFKNLVGAVMERALKVDKSKRTRAFHMTKASVEFAKKDFETMKKELQGENAKYAMTNDIEAKRTIFKNKLLETLRRKNFAALEKEDLKFLEFHYVRTLAKVITARGIDVNNIDPETLDKIRMFAVRQAQEYTYRDANALADVLNKGKRYLSTHDIKGLRVFGVLAEGTMPFVKTPLNIAKQGIMYSPYSILTGISKSFDKLARNGELSTAEIIDDFSKGLTGTGLLYLGYLLAQFGFLRGKDDEDKKRNQFDEMVGEQSFAFKVGDKSYTIDWMTPSSMPLFVGYELFNLVRDDFSFADITAAMSSLTDPVFELSVLSGISGVLHAVQYGEGNEAVSVISDMATSYLTQALPTIGGQFARMTDATQRNYYYVDKNSELPAGLQRIIGLAASKIPFASYLFEPSVDNWGREETYGGAVERALENFVSPGYYSETEYTKVDKELQRLYDKLGDSAVFPTSQQKYFVEQGKYYYMNAEDYTKTKKIRGTLSFDKVKELIRSEKYKRMSDEEKVDAISKCYKEAGSEAKEQMLDKVKKHNRK